MKIIKNLLTLIILFGVIYTSFSLAENVMAQTGDEEGVSIPFVDGDTINIGLFDVTNITNLARFGVLRMVVHIATFVMIWIFIYMIFNLIRFSYNFLQKESGEISEGIKGAEGTVRAFAFSLVMILAYAAVGIFLGVGNPLKWGNKLAQCGDGEFLFRAEYRAQLVNTEIFADESLIYCCTKFTGLLQDYERERAISVGGSELDGAIVGTPEQGGWLFISNVGGRYPSTVPVNVTGAEGCISFTDD
jgi:hypothetical protein